MINGSFDPEVLHVIEEVAGDPESRLFRVTPRQMRYAPLEWAPERGVLRAELSKAERYLLEVYPASTAEVLRRAFRERVFANPYTASYYYRDEPSQEGRSSRRFQDRRFGEEPGIRQLATLLAGDRCPQSPTLSALAAASLRIEGSGAAKVYCAAVHSVAGRPSFAVEVLTKLLGFSEGSRVLAHIHSNLGLAYSLRGNLPRATEHYLEGARHDHPSSVLHISACICAISLKDYRVLEQAFTRLDDHVDPSDDCLYKTIQAHGTRKARGELKTQPQLDWIPSSFNLGKTSRRLVETYAAI